MDSYHSANDIGNNQASRRNVSKDRSCSYKSKPMLGTGAGGDGWKKYDEESDKENNNLAANTTKALQEIVKLLVSQAEKQRSSDEVMPNYKVDLKPFTYNGHSDYYKYFQYKKRVMTRLEERRVRQTDRPRLAMSTLRPPAFEFVQQKIDVDGYPKTIEKWFAILEKQYITRRSRKEAIEKYTRMQQGSTPTRTYMTLVQQRAAYLGITDVETIRDQLITGLHHDLKDLMLGKYNEERERGRNFTQEQFELLLKDVHFLCSKSSGVPKFDQEISDRYYQFDVETKDSESRFNNFNKGTGNKYNNNYSKSFGERFSSAGTVPNNMNF